jgi:DNA-binding transcriptional LysR family regulator
VKVQLYRIPAQGVRRQRLFKRASAKLIPTEQALRLFEEVERAYFGMERIPRAADAIRQRKHGQIALVTLPAFSQGVLPMVCKRFLEAYPDVALNITPQEAPLLNEWLSSQRYDLGLIEEAIVPVLLRA